MPELAKPSRVVPQSLDELIRPESTCLIIWDAQKGLAGRATNLDMIGPNMQALLAAASHAGVLVAWSRHVDPPLNLTSEASLHYLMRRQGVDSVDAIRPYMQRGMPDAREQLAYLFG